MKPAILQLWQHRSCGSPETEAGCSLHLSIGEHRLYMNKYAEEHLASGIPPQHYECGLGKPVEVQISEKLYRKIEKYQGEHGLRLAGLPGSVQKLVPAEFTSLNKWGSEHISMPF